MSRKDRPRFIGKDGKESDGRGGYKALGKQKPPPYNNRPIRMPGKGLWLGRR